MITAGEETFDIYIKNIINASRIRYKEISFS